VSAEFYRDVSDDQFERIFREKYERARKMRGGRRRFRVLVDREKNVAWGMSGPAPRILPRVRVSGPWPQPGDAEMVTVACHRYAQFISKSRRSVLDMTVVFRGNRSARLFVRYARDEKYGYPLVSLIRWAKEDPLLGSVRRRSVEMPIKNT
jgi:hypothetical protein